MNTLSPWYMCPKDNEVVKIEQCLDCEFYSDVNEADFKLWCDYEV